MQLNFEEILNLIRLPLLIAGFFAFGIWYLIDTYRMSRFDGEIKRGIKVWSRELSYDSWQYLSSLKQDVFTEQKSLFSSYKTEFIRVDNAEMIICSNPKRSSSTWQCVGYIDLNSPLHELEYRMSLPGIIFLLPFTIFGILIFLISFHMYKNAIDSYIERKTAELNLRLSTFGNL